MTQEQGILVGGGRIESNIIGLGRTGAEWEDLDILEVQEEEFGHHIEVI